MVLAHDNSTDLCGPRWKKTIFSSKVFVFESNPIDRNGVWTNFDSCGNTAFYQPWNISSDLDFSRSDFIFTVKNVTTDTENRTYISGSFVIREDETLTSATASLIISSTSASPSPSGTTSFLSPTTSSSPNPHPGLSTGAKACIGVGPALAVIVLLLLGYWLYQKRGRADIKGGNSGRYRLKGVREGGVGWASRGRPRWRDQQSPDFRGGRG
ncbi:hypothetical protein BJX99DRAFT_224953 [Aspergillus californicus]